MLQHQLPVIATYQSGERIQLAITYQKPAHVCVPQSDSHLQRIVLLVSIVAIPTGISLRNFCRLDLIVALFTTMRMAAPARGAGPNTTGHLQIPL